MEIIPVIDLMGGNVVHAKAGQRETYQPINSVLTEATDLLTVVADMLAFFPFEIIYIADLDAIFGQKIDTAIYRHCLMKFPKTCFWLDAGIRSQTDWQQFPRSDRLVPVVGSESIQSLSFISDINPCVLSLDFKQGQFLGDERLLRQPEYWPVKVMVMNLDRVGIGQGPDFALLTEISLKKRDMELIAAGGVRGADDLVLLAQSSVEQVLVASALHNGVVTQEVLRNINTPAFKFGGSIE